MHARRWGDNDRYFGPFTYARDGKDYRPISVILSSGSEEYPGASFMMRGFGHTLILALPYWALKTYKEKVKANWDEATVKRLGLDWYFNVEEREYGFSIAEGNFNVSFGRQSMDRSKKQRWGCFLPWTQWRLVRHSFYGLNGEHVATLPDTGKPYKGDLDRFSREEAIADATPSASFKFKDFDGEEILVKTKIYELEWKFGEGWFKWLSLFRRPKISRSLDLRFSSETGHKKGSWKGGTIGHGIKMKKGELHEEAFRRYCQKNNMKFVSGA